MVRTFPHAVEMAADLPRFCPKCGAAMRDEDTTTGFDRRTGAPRLAALARCSRRVWFGADHDEYIVMPRPRHEPPDNSDDE